MIKIDTKLIKENLLSPKSENKYYMSCDTVVNVLKLRMFNDDVFRDEVTSNVNYIIWKKFLYFKKLSETEEILKFCFIVMLNLEEKKVKIFQFSFNDREELKLCCCFLVVWNNCNLIPKYGWSFMIDNENIPYAIDEFSPFFIDSFLNEIRKDVTQIFI